MVVGSGVLAVPLTAGTAEAAAPTVNWGPIADDLGDGGPPQGWGGVISCESGWNPRAHNSHSSASGLFQFLSGTWRSLGGLRFGRTAADASPEEQMEIANRAYARDGLTPWEASKSCWRRRTYGSSSYGFEETRTYRGRHHRVVEPRRFEYVIQLGDTLSSIAENHGHTWREVFQENRNVLSNPDLINVGAVINL